jgi:NADPH-dependent 2,4-dienoyl-CoA reductase/sulfur reductase-like enzyme
VHYVIVGNGVCGMEAALLLRARDTAARITLVSSEHPHFFSRPAIMYVFAGQLRVADTEPYDRGLYQRMGFERVGRRVVSVDAAGHRLGFHDAPDLTWDRLLLAVGSAARPAPWPGADGPGVHGFVTLRDLEALDAAAKRGQRAIVIGGGLIGVEAAEVLHHRGLEVAFLVRENWYFPVALESREAALVAEHLRGHGVDVRLGAETQEILRHPDGGLRGVRAGGVEFPADLVVSAIGVVPNTSFLASSAVPLARNGAIEVDGALRTTLPDVWAAGDCANVLWSDGTRRPEQLWYTARDQGRVAARSMLGDDVSYRRGAWYNSAKFFDIEYTTVGLVPALLNFDNTPLDPGPELRSWFARDPVRPVSQRIVLKGERVVGFNMLGSRWDHELLLRWIEERRDLPFVLDHLDQARFDEEFEPRFRAQAAMGLS